MKEKVTNIFWENLDVLIEWSTKSNKVLIFVHGFGTDKDEWFHLFSEMADFLKNDFLCVRFDLSWYGKSEGRDYEFQFQKAAGDVDAILRYVRKKFPEKDLYLLAHSLGTFVVSMLSPFWVKKTVFTGIPNANTDTIINQIQGRILSKGGKVDENSFTHYPRSTGTIQMLGKDFWRTLRGFEPVEYIENLGNKTNLLILKPKNDDILKDEHFEEYKKIENVKYVEVEGDHNFTDKKDRKELFGIVKGFLM